MLLDLDRSTSKAIPYSQWETSPVVVVETDEAFKIYEDVFGAKREND